MAETDATNDKYSNSPRRAYAGEINDLGAGGTDIRLALLDTAYSPDLSAHEVWADVSADEVSGQGYTADGQELTGKSLSEDAGVVTFDADDVVWDNSTIDSQYGVLYDATPSDAADQSLLCLIDFGQEMSSDDGDFTIAWDSSGIFEVDTTV